jgi:hypothetical protein
VRAGTSLITLCVSARTVASLIAVGASGLALAACGGDDEDADRAPPSVPAETLPAPVTTPPPETAPPPGGEPDPRAEPPEAPPEGDEEAIRSEAVFTGRGGRLTPPEVRVPPYIAIRVILRSPDAGRDQSYTLTIGGRRLAIGHTRTVDEAELDGLLPGRAYRGRSPQGAVRVVASAEPGP